jgi:hypothetical protein
VEISRNFSLPNAARGHRFGTSLNSSGLTIVNNRTIYRVYANSQQITIFRRATLYVTEVSKILFGGEMPAYHTQFEYQETRFYGVVQIA